MTAKWLSKRIQNSLKDNPIKKIKDIKENAQMKGNVGVNKTKEIRGICGARSMVYGSFLELYTIIYDYYHKNLIMNLGST